MTDLKIQHFYKEEILRKIERRGAKVPFILLVIVLIFTVLDYTALGLASIPFRLLAIIPMFFSICAHLLHLNPKILGWLQNAWLLGGNLMMAGLCFIVYTQYPDDLMLKAGTILGYSLVIYICILVTFDSFIFWATFIPLIISSSAIYVYTDFDGFIYLINLYGIVGASLLLLRNIHIQNYNAFKDKLVIEDLNKKLEDFVHISSHDLKSPLGTISMHIDFINKYVKEHKYDKIPEKSVLIKNTVKHMDRLLEDILTYSKISEEDTTEWVDINQIIVRVQNDLGEMLAEANVRFDTVASLPKIQGSQTRLYQIFLNLLSNAIKYRDPQKQLYIKIRIKHSSEGATISIHDNGLGIPHSMQSRIFKPFERYHANVPGSGLGLAMVENHMERHGGSIRLDSAEGVGSTFYLHFPKVIIENTYEYENWVVPLGGIAS